MVKEKGSLRKNGSTLNRGGAVISHICKTGEFGARRIFGLKCRCKSIKKCATLAWVSLLWPSIIGGFPKLALGHQNL